MKNCENYETHSDAEIIISMILLKAVILKQCSA